MSDSESTYPLDHRSGYAVVPRAVARFEPVIRSPRVAQLYLWIACHAAHVGGVRQGSNGEVAIGFGECFLGRRALADALDMDRKTVDRGLKKLERLGLIATKAGPRGTVVTLLRYGDFPGYQGRPGGQEGGQDMGQGMGQGRGQERAPKERENDRTGERENRVAPDPAGASQLSLVPSEAKPQSSSENRKAKAKPKPSGDHQALVAHFHEAYKRRHGGSSPTWSGPQAAAIKALLSAHGLEECKRRVDAFFARPDGSWPEDFDLLTLRRHFDKFAAKSAPRRAPSGRRRL